MPWSMAASMGLQALGGVLGRRSAKRAARAREQAYRDASEIVGTAHDEAAAFLDPRHSQEQAAIERVNALLGLGGEAPDFDLFRSTPGYQFALDEGQRAIDRSAAARGGLVSGNTLAELTRYGTGLADQTFQNYLGNVLGLQSQGVDAALANMRTGLGAQQADFRLGAGGARASGIEGATAAVTGALTGMSGTLGQHMGNNALASLLRPQSGAVPGTGGGGLPPIQIRPVRPQWTAMGP